jgi:hypothetical protein
MSDPESVGGNGGLLNTAALDGLEAQGDARAAWEAVALCIEKGLPFPDWVTRYLATTAKALLDYHDGQHPLNLKRVLGLDRLNKPDAYDPDRDAEEVYERIATWIADGEVKNISEGARRYHREVLQEIGAVETVRELFYRGQNLHPMSRRAQKGTKPLG